MNPSDRERSDSLSNALGRPLDEVGRPDERPRFGAMALAAVAFLAVALVAGAVPLLHLFQRPLLVSQAAHVSPSPTVTPVPTPPPAAAPPPPAPPAAAPLAAPAPPPAAPRTPAPTPPPTAPPPTPTPPATASVPVPAAAGWVSTGLNVTAGRALSVSASGSWTGGPPQTGMVGPDGSSTAWPDNFFDLQELGVCNFCAKIHTPHWEALVGYVGSDPPPPGSYTSTSALAQGQRVFLVGSSFQGSAPGTGTLWLAMNDDAYSANGGDNAGQVSANVTAAS
jgi:hypothetical protein